MATNTLNTKLKLRYDTFANWSRTDVDGQYSKLVLLEGEPAICYVPSASSVKDGKIVSAPPTILMKIGDGVSTFADLDWVSSLSADIYDWAKAATPESIPLSTGDKTLGEKLTELEDASVTTAADSDIESLFA